ncbi:hypothetical protein BKA82DRAFT_2571072 [Pisolithus tinctorius]|nr:hypothetical protein BKA82DRAFT_2571072 [Pisolithus tinctorius]
MAVGTRQVQAARFRNVLSSLSRDLNSDPSHASCYADEAPQALPVYMLGCVGGHAIQVKSHPVSLCHPTWQPTRNHQLLFARWVCSISFAGVERRPTFYRLMLYRPTFYQLMFYRPTLYRPMFYQLMFYRPTFYRPTLYRPAFYRLQFYRQIPWCCECTDGPIFGDTAELRVHLVL